jgi:hypothetical protein
VHEKTLSISLAAPPRLTSSELSVPIFAVEVWLGHPGTGGSLKKQALTQKVSIFFLFETWKIVKL